MFKKSLLAVAVLGTAAGFASAADVTLYGIADAGLVYTNTQTKFSESDKVKEHKFDMQSGVGSGSRFGLMGTEDLGNGLKVGFKLENGFNTDDGSLDNDGRLFGREASLTVSSDFGALSMGRMGGIGSGAGTYNLFTATADAFDGGNLDVNGLINTRRYDNMITYQTPKFAGIQGTFQYSFKGNTQKDKDLRKGFYDPSTGREGSAATDRYASAGLTGDFGALQTVLTYEYLNYASNGENGKYYNKDGLNGQIISLGGNYDCGFAKTFVAAQYFKDVLLSDNALFPSNRTVDSAKGYALALGAIVPVASADMTVAYYYRDADFEETTEAGVTSKFAEAKYHGLTAKYEYPLSKRTSLYTGAGWSQEKTKFDAHSRKETIYQAFAGMTHKF